MRLKGVLAKIFTLGFFNPRWRCNACGKEIFDGEFFCKDCEKQLPFNDKNICNHCGRRLRAGAEYCSTCKENMLSIDKGRSVFDYAPPVSGLIKKAKYDNGKYILDYFAERLAFLYLSGSFRAEIACCVPMSEKRRKKRGYNQSEILAKKVAEKTGVVFCDCVEKARETVRQATLSRAERLKNLADSFKVKDKKAVRGKNVLIIDDVTTTGATAEAIAIKLKKAGALRVYLLTVASVSPKDGY